MLPNMWSFFKRFRWHDHDCSLLESTRGCNGGTIMTDRCWHKKGAETEPKNKTAERVSSRCERHSTPTLKSQSKETKASTNRPQ